MDEASNNLPVYPYEVIKDNGGIVVRRNTALVDAIRSIRERLERLRFNSEDGFISKSI